MEYIGIYDCDYDKVLDFLDRKNISYEEIDSDNIIEDDETVLEDASTEDILDELKSRREYDSEIFIDFLSKEKTLKKEFICNLLGLNRLASTDDICEAVRNL